MLGNHANTRQRRRIFTIGGLAAAPLLAWIVWPSATPQTPTSSPQNAATAAPPITAPPSATAPKSATTTNPVEGIGAFSTTPGAVGAATGVGASSSPIVAAGSPAASTTVGTTTTTTGQPIPPAGTISYTANVDPRFTQDPTNPLKVTYGFSATASILENSAWESLSDLPAGTLTLFSDVGQICTLVVGGVVTSATCATTYPAFGSHNVVANYIVNGTTYISPLLTDNVQPFSTTTTAIIQGGGSKGGLVFVANVVDQNGNAVKTGTVSETIADTTQGWSYTVNALFGAADGANPDSFGCILVENYPKVGEYSGCGFGGQIIETPLSGDTLTETATYSGINGWTGSSAMGVTYAMP